MLYSYCIPVDDGAAPNPYWEVCTLTICKPVIRRTANIGDWIVATGSKNSSIGDISKKVVYIMQVTNKLTLEKYNEYCLKNLPGKIPDIHNKDLRKHVGDCIYYFVNGEIKMRPGVHGLSNKKTDLGGIYALLSDHFYYFGDNPIELKEELYPIIKNGQGHRSKSNIPYEKEFLKWVNEFNYTLNKPHGKPQIEIDFSNRKHIIKENSEIRLKTGEQDEEECIKGICYFII
jgi:hypothetical protein